jgi:hypothetical protein
VSGQAASGAGTQRADKDGERLSGQRARKTERQAAGGQGRAGEQYEKTLSKTRNTDNPTTDKRLW